MVHSRGETIHVQGVNSRPVCATRRKHLWGPLALALEADSGFTRFFNRLTPKGKFVLFSTIPKFNVVRSLLIRRHLRTLLAKRGGQQSEGAEDGRGTGGGGPKARRVSFFFKRNNQFFFFRNFVQRLYKCVVILN
jgi:hypothetical protein